jgi:hypothetical protein
MAKKTIAHEVEQPNTQSIQQSYVCDVKIGSEAERKYQEAEKVLRKAFCCEEARKNDGV